MLHALTWSGRWSQAQQPGNAAGQKVMAGEQGKAGSGGGGQDMSSHSADQLLAAVRNQQASGQVRLAIMTNARSVCLPWYCTGLIFLALLVIARKRFASAACLPAGASCPCKVQKNKGKTRHAGAPCSAVANP